MWVKLLSTYEYLNIFSLRVENSIIPYLRFTVIYTTEDNRENMNWQLNHVVTQAQSDSIISFLG